MGAGRTSAAAMPRSFEPLAAPSPWGRALVPAASTVILGLGGHAFGGGTVALTTVLFAFLPMLAICRSSCTRELSLVRLALIVTVGQVWVHVVAGFCGHDSESSVGMIAGHGIAALLMALVLRRREASLWASARAANLLAWLTRLLSTTRWPSVPVRLQSLPLPAVPMSALICAFSLLPLDRRGPPLAFSL